MSDAPDTPDPAVFQSQDPSIEQDVVKGLSPAASGPLRSPLISGQRWRNYQVGDPFETDTGWCYHAVNVGMLEDVHIRVLPYNGPGDVRAQAWQALHELGRPGILRSMEVVEEEGFRFEITPPPPPTTLRDWAACRKATIEDIEHVVRQVGDALAAMHDCGLVHLNLRPDTIFLPSEGSVQQVLLGGLEHLTVYNQPGLIPVPVDPLYAPPEAAGLSKHSPGAGLRAWDWWSLGRILQELTLGRHVLGIVMNRDITSSSPEVRSRAETLLLERDPRAPRAGAVELMPPMSQRLTDLLRGLLTSSRDGRWGADEIHRWLKQQPVKDRYQLSRNEQLFAWKDRAFTIPEAAEYFSRESEWTDGLRNLFDADDPTTLVSFVGERPEYKQAADRIADLKKFMQIPAWKNLPEEALETVIAAAAWLLLGGEEARLVLHGQRVDANCIKGLFARGGVEGGVAMARALIAKPYIQLVEQADPDAGRLLSTLGAIVNGEAVSSAISQGWLDLGNPADYARLLLLAMEPERKLFDLRTSLNERFACSREKPIQHLFTQQRLSHAELVLLASTAAQPERYRYVTHDDYKAERYEELRQRAVKLVHALFWQRLGTALRAGALLLGYWPVALGCWLLVAAVASALRQWSHWPLWLVGAAGTFAFLRMLAGKSISISLTGLVPDVQAWRFGTPLSRCGAETQAALSTLEKPPAPAQLSDELAGIYKEARALGLKSVTPMPRCGRPFKAWGYAIFSWLALMYPLAEGVFLQMRSPAPPPETDPRSAAVQAIEQAMKAAPPGMERTAEDLFFDNPANPRARWDVSRPDEAQRVPLAAVKPASPDDVARVLIDGQRLLLPYQQSTVDSLIAVPVEGKDGTGLMLYDGRNRRIIERQILQPSELPADKSWFEIDRLKVFYAGPPPPPPPAAPKPVIDPQKPRDTSDLPEREVRRGAYQETPMPNQQKATQVRPLSEALDSMTP